MGSDKDQKRADFRAGVAHGFGITDEADLDVLVEDLRHPVDPAEEADVREQRERMDRIIAKAADQRPVRVLSVRMDAADYDRLGQTAVEAGYEGVSAYVRRLIDADRARRENVSAAEIDAAIATLEALRTKVA